MLAHWNNSPWKDMSPHPDTLSWFRVNRSFLFLLNTAWLSFSPNTRVLDNKVFGFQDDNSIKNIFGMLWCVLNTLWLIDAWYYRGRRVRDRMVIGLTTTNAIGAYHWCCGLDSRSGEEYNITMYVIKFVSDFRQVGGFLRVLRFPPPIKLTATT